MTVLEKCKEYCRRQSTSEEHYKELLGRIWINPNVRNEECSRPNTICENCSLNRFRIKEVGTE